MPNKFYSNKIIVFFSICLLSFILYGNTISHDFSLDDNYITDNLPPDNKVLESFDQNFDRVDYRPIPIITFALQKVLQGEIKPNTSHFLNIIFYILGAFAFYNLLLYLLKKHEKKYILAFCITLIFVAHPIHSNVVSSIKNRDILLSFLFAILGFRAFIKFHLYSKKRYLISCFFLITFIPIIRKKFTAIFSRGLSFLFSSSRFLNLDFPGLS